MNVALVLATSFFSLKMAISTRNSCLPACITSAFANRLSPVGGRIKEMDKSVVAENLPSGRTDLTAAPAAVSASDVSTPP